MSVLSLQNWKGALHKKGRIDSAQYNFETGTTWEGRYHIQVKYKNIKEFISLESPSIYKPSICVEIQNLCDLKRYIFFGKSVMEAMKIQSWYTNNNKI